MTSSGNIKFDILYDSSKPGAYQFYNTSSSQFITSQEAETLTNRGECRLVIGEVPVSPSPVVDIIYDVDSLYWECYYNTDTDSFLCAQDANTLVDVGLARIVPGTIPYVITEDGEGCFYDVVRNVHISGEEADSLVKSGKAVLKQKKSSLEPAEDYTLPPEDTSPTSGEDQVTGNSGHVTEPAALPDYETATTLLSNESKRPTLLEIATNPACAKDSLATETNHGTSSKPPVSYDPGSNLPQPRSDTSSSLSSPPCSGQPRTKQRASSSSSSTTLKDIVVPIAAGVGIAAVGIASVAAAIFLGGGDKKKRRK